MGLQIHTVGVSLPRGFLHKTIWKICLQDLVNQEIRKKAHINIVLVSDEELLKMNKQFLQHDTLTDILTFPIFEDERRIEGELYISWDRVGDNAQTFGVDTKVELMRVMIHGLLHLAGFKDKTQSEVKEMRSREEYWLNQFLGKY